jgi:hypothetical protein
MKEKSKPQVFSNRWADAAGPSGQGSARDVCRCIERISTKRQRPTRFHPERHSVCDRRIQGVSLRQVWISLRTSGADVLPLLVNACSTACVDALPTPTEGYVQTPHTGGPGVDQPPA